VTSDTSAALGAGATLGRGLFEPDEDPRRRAVLEAAVELLASEGPHGLSLRRIAAAVGGSTQLIYTLFGGKQGLADALYAEGFRRLNASGCDDITASGARLGEPERIVEIGRAYLRFAQDEPAFFAVMFGRAIPDFVPSAATRHAAGEATFQVLVEAAQACLDQGTLVAPDALRLARLCWASAHGAASLLAARMIDDAGFAEAMLWVPIRAHLPA
jgi:AcrR family transcriptional regulator